MTLPGRLLTEPPPKLPARDPRGHKGSFGTVLVAGGSGANPRMIGAPALAAIGALRAGCGLVKVLSPAPILSEVISLCPSATGWGVPVDGDAKMIAHEASRGFDALAPGTKAIVVGPGLGAGPGPSRLALRAIQHEECPVILDADAINALAAIPELHRDWKCAAVLTPHPGEFRRLAESLKIDADPVDIATRPSAAEELAQRLGAIVVLKGAGTVVSDGLRTWVNSTGGPELATAGTGDVLAGVIAGIVAQHVRIKVGGVALSSGAPDMEAVKGLARAKLAARGIAVPPAARVGIAALATAVLDLFDAARIAVVVHASAGERWREATRASGGMLATELAALVPEVMEEWREP